MTRSPLSPGRGGYQSGDATRRARRVEHEARFPQVASHPPLAEHMFSPLQRGHRRRHVQPGRRRYYDRMIPGSATSASQLS